MPTNNTKESAKATTVLKGHFTEEENVFFFIPNLIGYARVILAIVSLYFMRQHPNICMVLYSLSCLLDAADGVAARRFNQCSKFGAVLDMVTDRCTTACLLCYLAIAYQDWAILFQLLIALDLSSHYMHMYSSLQSGASSHKKISETSNWFLRQYYSNNIVLFSVCFANELFFVLMYLRSFTPSPLHPYVFWTLAALTGPICAGKQVISVIQMIGASKNLVHIDTEERKQLKKAN
ncbi:CDP-diacylglycerol-inositol 3-phosphatidyltransferase [Actinomortierella wolfii]|nr:CDP-diacylglycerol-inositol 3-phosphatidyltransferase [Actinomortierella wolfii]